jgi:valyl-tRNA synthetase
MKLDPKLPLSGTLYARGAASDVAMAQAEAIRRLANVNLKFVQDGIPPKGAVRSTHEFDLSIEVPIAQTGAHRTRLEKEKEQLEKVIANSRRQLSDEKFMSKAPPKVVDSIRQKLGEYDAQLTKINTSLDGLAE